MTLADERRSRRFRSSDALEVRVFLFLVGTAFLVTFVVGVVREQGAFSWLTAALAGLLLVLAVWCLLVSVFGSRARVEKLSNATDSSELIAVAFLLAFPVSWLVRRITRRETS